MSKIPMTKAVDSSSIEYQLVRTVNGNLEFGLNLKSTAPIAVLTPAVADTQFSVDHNLGFIPNGYIVLSKDAYSDVKKGATPWTTSKLYLKCNQASVNLVLVVA